MITPWRNNAIPHDDVLTGSFQQAEFAADITQVHEGKARPEYQDPVEFFNRTFITEGMRQLLITVIKRMNGEAVDPIIQLQTSFGGGKTHTMLAAMHLVSGQTDPRNLTGISPLLDAAQCVSVPQAKVAVIDGIKYSANQPVTKGGCTIHTIWGDLAYQLAGSEGYAVVARDDEAGTSPGKDALAQVMAMAGPCVILIDEMVAYIRQFYGTGKLAGGTFDSNLSFIQALTEAVKSTPKAILLASLPEAAPELGDAGIAVESTVQSHFSRLHAIWKPVGIEESFEIVRRRLFKSVESDEVARKVCQEFMNTYGAHKADLPPDVQQAAYLERMIRAYPIHPELFDRLYEDWAALPNFQRTRGVLRIMARIIHRLWREANNDAMIMPASIPLNDQSVRADIMYHLPVGWEQVVIKDIDYNNAETWLIESADARFGRDHTCRRLARTIFMDSAPGVGNNPTARGIEDKQILLGTLQPGQNVGLYKDGLKRLADRLTYINVANDRYWFDSKPNLRKEMEARKPRYGLGEHLIPLLKERIQQQIPRSGEMFDGIHVFTASADIGDEWALKLVVLPPTVDHGDSSRKAEEMAMDILCNRGEQPRVKRNRLMFLAADNHALRRLTDQIRTYLAWKDIVAEGKAATLTMDQHQMSQAQRQLEVAEQSMSQVLRDTYRWLLVPEQMIDAKTKLPGALRLEPYRLDSSRKTIGQDIEHTCREHELVITQWAPAHLRAMLKKDFWKEGSKEVSFNRVWEAIACYPYLDARLKDSRVLVNTVAEGVQSRDFFAYAQDKEDGKYLGFLFGASTTIFPTDQSLLIDPVAAAAYEEEHCKPVVAPSPGTGEDDHPVGPIPATDPATAGSGTAGQGAGAGTGTPPVQAVAKVTEFNLQESLDPFSGGVRFTDIMQEIVANLTAQHGADVKIYLEVHASADQGFSDQVKRAVSENCRALKLKGDFE